MAEAPSESARIAEQYAANLDALVAEMDRRDRYKIRRYFQDEGPTARHLYPKAVAFFDAGRTFRERAAIAANRVGKTDMGTYELTLHLTGEYPHWWTGRVFTEPIRAWAAGTTSEKTKEILQTKLIGQDSARGTGMIPARHLHHIQPKGGGIPGSIGAVWVRHTSGGVSHLQFKSYDQGRTAFEGTEQHVILLDEEPYNLEIYTECLLRTMATGDFGGGCVMLTFTPLEGPTAIVNRFMINGVFPPDYIVPD